MSRWWDPGRGPRVNLDDATLVPASGLARACMSGDVTLAIVAPWLPYPVTCCSPCDVRLACLGALQCHRCSEMPR